MTKRQREKELALLEAERDAMPVVERNDDGDIHEHKEAARAQRYTEISDRISEIVRELDDTDAD